MRLKHLIIAMLTIALSSVFADTISAQQNFHFRKGWEYADIDWEQSAFYEWERGMSAGEMSSTVMVAACYMREYGVGRNVSKGVSILENLAAKNAEVALFTANFWFPILDNDSFVNYIPHAGGQYNFWAMASWWKEPDLKSTTFGLESNYNKVIKYAKMYLSKVSTPGYGRSLANDMIGYCYENGLGGVSKDIAKAMEYYSNAGSDKIYSSATNLIKDIDSIEELEKVVSSIKPYLDDDVLSALDKKPNIDGYYDEKDRFIGTYVSKYKQQAANNAQIWLDNHNLFENSESFKEGYKKLNTEIQAEILKYLDDEYTKTNSADTLFKIWLVYPCEEATYKNVDHIACEYTRLISNEIKQRCGKDYNKLFSEYWNILNNNPIINSKLHYYTTFSDGKYLSPQYGSYRDYIYADVQKCMAEWGNLYILKLTYKSSESWLWSLDSIPLECKNVNICIGSSSRNDGRKHIISGKKELENKLEIIASKNSIVNYFTYNFNREILDLEVNVKQAYDFIRILEKEDNKSITPEDYTEYLKKYPDAYYKQYCIDGYAMTTANTYTLDTPKEEIKTLLKSGISKGAAKYVKEHTKKSYLKTKSL